MRIFAALDLPPGLLEYISELQNQCRLAHWFRASYPLPSNLHLTLLFLGHVKSTQLDMLKTRFKQTFLPPVSGFISHLQKIEQRSHLLWMKLDDPDMRMADLAGRLQENLDPKHPSTRPFLPHITVLRIRQPLQAKEKIREELKNIALFSQPILLDRVSLYHSELTAKGSVYTCLDSVRLLPLVS